MTVRSSLPWSCERLSEKWI